MPIKCLALASGYDGLAVRNPGDEFELPDGSEPAEWFKVLSGNKTKGKNKSVDEGDNGQADASALA